MSGEPKPTGSVTSVRVRIAGDEYAIKGNGSPEYIKKLAELVDSYLNAVLERHPTLPRNRASILALLNLADDLEKQRQENRELRELLSEIEK